MGCSKSSSKREVYSNTILPQEIRKTLNRQPNFTLKATGKRQTKKPQNQQKETNHKDKTEINEKEMKETILNINETKSWLFEKKNQMTNLQPDSTRKKEKNQINKIRNEKGEVTTDNAEIQRIIREYYEQLNGNKMDNLEKLERFF